MDITPLAYLNSNNCMTKFSLLIFISGQTQSVNTQQHRSALDKKQNPAANRLQKAMGNARYSHIQHQLEQGN